MSTKRAKQAATERKESVASRIKEKKEYKRAAGADERRTPVERTNSNQGLNKRKTASANVETQQTKKAEKQPRVRVFPIWLRLVVVIILTGFALVAGLMIGFGVIGDGTPTDALKVETWRHIIDIIVKE